MNTTLTHTLENVKGVIMPKTIRDSDGDYYLECPHCHSTCATNENIEHDEDCIDKGFF
jgi:hypothetical protein